MSQFIDRRAFLNQSLQTALAVGAGTALTQVAEAAPHPASIPAQQGEWRVKKSVMWAMLPSNLSFEDRFKLAKDVGFAGVEIDPVHEEDKALEFRRASDKVGIPVQSIIYGGWHAPLSDPDPKVQEAGMEDVKKALQCAKWVGADNILLVPAVVTPKVRYHEAYTRSQANIRKLIPTAEKHNVLILVEEVWNKFLLSPLEFAHYIDEFKHPLIQAYFDIGNVVLFAYPEDWIRTLGKRIRKVHLKDFKRGNSQFVNLREGDVDWKEVRKAFMEVGFTSFMNTELGGGDEAYLRDVSQRVDKIIAGV
ncbi:xylose isomerase [Armatimonadota bacterium]|nr:xylose isomerase [Armatimonadota bacterium]